MNNIWKRIIGPALGFIVTVGTGCQVEERMAWSPGGDIAAVRTEGKLRLAYPDGTLSEPMACDIAGMAWLPDESGLVLVRTRVMNRWEDMARLLPPEATWFAEAVGRALPDLLRTGMQAFGGDREALIESHLQPLGLPELPVPAALLYLHDNHAETWAELMHLMNPPPDEEDADEPHAEEPPRAEVHELAILPIRPDRSAGELRVIRRSLTRMSEPRPSLTSPVLAVIEGDELSLLPLDGKGERVVVANRVSGSFDWTPDGRALAFARRHGRDWERNGLNPAGIHRRTVIGNDGTIRLGQDELLAVSIYAFPPRVRCLPDGRILFAGITGSFPAQPTDSGEARFFTADADGVTPVPTAAGTLPTDLGSFAVSPGGRRVAVVEFGSDIVATVDLVSGDVNILWDAQVGQSRTQPAWRNDRELYFAALTPEDGANPKWMRVIDARPPEVFSAEWPAATTRELIQRRRGAVRRAGP